MTRTRIISFVVFCLYIAAVCYLCFSKPGDIPTIQLNFFGLPVDKIVHFLMFLPFPLLAYRSFDSTDSRNSRRILLIVGMTAAVIALAAVT